MNSIVTYEADGILLDVVMPESAPIIGFAEAHVKDKTTTVEIVASIIAADRIRVSSDQSALPPGSWLLQVRAGADSTTSRTVYETTIVIKDSIKS